jgi:hypothetical protein
MDLLTRVRSSSTSIARRLLDAHQDDHPGRRALRRFDNQPKKIVAMSNPGSAGDANALCLVPRNVSSLQGPRTTEFSPR